MNEVALWRRLLAELLGSAFLAALVIGSGIAPARLSPGDTGLELLENAAATAAGLFAIILMFGPVSGGHFNPVVSLVDAAFGGLSWRGAGAYVPGQVARCGARRLHRRRLLVHELDELRQPGDLRRAHVLRHVRGDRPGVRSAVRAGTARGWRDRVRTGARPVSRRWPGRGGRGRGASRGLAGGRREAAALGPRRRQRLEAVHHQPP